MKVMSIQQAIETGEAIDHAIQLVRDKKKPYTVVYMDKMNKVIPMQAEPCPSEFDIQVITTIIPD
tara:strand:- start:498 stop:692 length:195 start_codon:yes stop_codon:yes gene_type:complete